MRRACRLAVAPQLAALMICAGLSPVVAGPAVAASPGDSRATRGAAIAAHTEAAALLASARLWRQRGRDDLARAALLKLLSVTPTQRDALRLLIAIDIEAGRLDEAQRRLTLLEHAHPGAAEVSELGTLLGSVRTQGVAAVRDRLRALGEAAPVNARAAAAPRAQGTPLPAAPAATAQAAAQQTTAPSAVSTPPAATAPDPAELARERRAQADALLAAGQESAALAALQEAVRLDPRFPWARLDLARLQQRRGDAPAARATIEAGLAAAPDDPETAYAAALYYAGIDADTEARAVLGRIDREHWSEGMRRLDARLHVAALLATARTRAGDRDAAGARAALREAAALAPDDASVLVRAGWTAQSIGDYAASRHYFEDATRAARAGAAADEAAAAQRGLDYLESLRQGFVTSGFEFSRTPGEAGISHFERRIVPVELRWALDYDRQLFAHADHLDLSAGRLDLTDFARVVRYGQILAAGPPGPGGSQRPGASGLMAGIGYQDRHWRVDAGHLPGSFPVSYAVGGLRYQTRVRGVDWSADLARRAVTSTLISFAGVRDPASGQRWGGVHRTGLTLGASGSLHDHDAYARLGVYALAGRNVLDNTESELRAGYDWYRNERAAARLTLGTALTVWRFTHNQRFQTFGHGGYYSPQSYVALSLPLQWSGTRGAWTWRTRAAVAWSTTHEDAAPYHPTDAALQAAAVAQAAALGLGSPVYRGGHGGGPSLSASGSVEYRISAGWTVGARFDLDRSEDYAPDTAGVWFRYRFNQRGALWGAPRAPAVYASY